MIRENEADKRGGTPQYGKLERRLPMVSCRRWWDLHADLVFIHSLCLWFPRLYAIVPYYLP
jgi:hypothetical protein